MSLTDKAKQKAEQMTGAAKEKYGDATPDSFGGTTHPARGGILRAGHRRLPAQRACCWPPATGSPDRPA
ncbi:CsbD family protein, partial [Micromonospora sp. NPDC049523]|uniref:CsbD family protein n=1 Tax=Micromonospora sp. NPDC049523 TaxID=3155921 RepID=UPI00344A279E